MPGEGEGWINVKAIARGLNQAVREVEDERPPCAEAQNPPSVSIVLLQEIITDAGRHFATSQSWTLVYGKLAREWRGEGVAFISGMGKHSRSQVMQAGVATVLHMGSGKKWGLMSVHVPHHATIAQAEALMAQWGNARP